MFPKDPDTVIYTQFQGQGRRGGIKNKDLRMHIKYYLTFYCFFLFVNFTSCTPVLFFSSPDTHHPILQHSTSQRETREKLAVEAILCHSLSHSIQLPMSSHFFQMFIAMTGWSGVNSLTSATLSILKPHCTSSQISFLVLCLGVHVVLNL